MTTVAQEVPCAYNSAARTARGMRVRLPLLMDEVLERISRARDSMEEGAYSEKSRWLHGALQKVGSLRAGLDLDGGDAHAANFDDLYDYISRQLIAANVQDRVEMLDEVSDLLRQVRAAWLAYV